MSDQPTSFMPNYVRKKPIKAVVVSKLNTDKENNNNGKKNMKISGNIPEVSKSISEKIKSNENIMQLFPDTELAMQILTSTVISPNDMLTPSLIYALESITLPSNVKATILNQIKTYIDTNYKLVDKLPTILSESLFTKGAYIEAIIPEASLDEIINPINQVDGQISLESLYTNNGGISALNESMGYLSNVNGKSDVEVSNEELATVYVNDEDYLKNKSQANLPKISLSVEDDMFLSVTDNPKILNAGNRLFETMQDIARNKARGNKGYNAKISIEGADDEVDLDKLFRVNVNMEEKSVITAKLETETVRSSVGKPLILKLSPESVIPVHIKSEPSKHLGYFILLDETGSPITNASSFKLNDQEYDSIVKSNKNNEASIINKATKALKGITNKDRTLDNLEELYSTIVEKTLRDRLTNGMFGDVAEIRDNSDIYRVMLHRALKAQKTKVLFLPTELVSYFAFEYRENGTGKSLLEKVTMLYSMRSIILFSRLMASVNNSITTTEVSAELDDDDPDPNSTMQTIMSEALKTRKTQLPLGVTRLDDISEWIHKVGFKFKFKHESLPDMDIQTSNESPNKTLPDDDLDDKIEEYIIMSFGLTPEMVKSGYDSDFATTFVAKNLLLAKRVTQTQNIFTPMISEHIKRLLKSDSVIRTKIENIIKSNHKDIIKSLANKANDETSIDYKKIPKTKLSDYLVNSIFNDLEVDLPKPEMHEANAMEEAFNSYSETVDNYLELVISDETIPEDLIGMLGDKIENVRKAVKSVIIRKWMADNNYLPELQELGTLDEEGNPRFEVLKEYGSFVESFAKSVLPFIKQMEKLKKKTDEKIEKIENDEEEEEPEEEEPTEEETETEEPEEVGEEEPGETEIEEEEEPEEPGELGDQNDGDTIEEE